MRHLLVTLLLGLPLTVCAEDTMKNNANEISKHYFAQPSLYQLDTINKEKL